jgi:FkbM family methyltransferase
MIERIRQMMIFFRNLGLIVANKSGRNRQLRNLLLRDYLVFKILSWLPRFVSTKIRRLSFLGHSLSFFDLKTTVALIEAIFIENEYFFKAKNRKPTIVDLGSNIGLSVIYLKTLYPNSKVTAFEADTVTYEMMKKNIENYKLRNVQVNNIAITNKKGFVDFYIASTGLGSPLMSTNPLRITKKRRLSVVSEKLSNILKKKVDFLKMDIEGSEYEVLKDLNRTKKIRLIKQMSIEYHHHIDKKQDRFSQFLSILEKNNFGYQIHAGQNTPFNLSIFEDIQVHCYKKD